MQSSPPPPEIVSATALPTISSFAPVPLKIPVPETTAVSVIPAQIAGFRSSALIGVVAEPDELPGTAIAAADPLNVVVPAKTNSAATSRIAIALITTPWPPFRLGSPGGCYAAASS